MKYYTKIVTFVVLITFSGLAQTANASSFAAPVQVANPDTSPVPVRVIGNAAYKPFQIMLDHANQEFSFRVPTGKRRVIDYLLDPVMRYRDESLRER